MKRFILMLVLLASSVSIATADVPNSEYIFKTQELAEEFVKYSAEGNYKKTYKAIRKIQKFVQRLDNEQIFDFIGDIDTAVGRSCEKRGMTQEEIAGLKEVVYAILPNALREAAEEKGIVTKD